MFGRNINELIDYTNEPYQVKIDLADWKKHQHELVSLIFPAVHLRTRQLKEKQIKMFQKYRHNVLERELPPGSKVMIEDPLYIKNPTTRPKELSKYIGPYYVIRRSLHGPYLLRDKTGETYERPVPISHMKIITRSPSKIKESDENEYAVDYS
jgi:hypothetical protein